MEKQALIFWQAFTQQGPLWAGWEHPKTPIGFHDDKSAIVFGHPNPGVGFVEKEEGGIKFHVAQPKPNTFTANTAINLNGIYTATIMWHMRDHEAMVGLISHEAFHAHQMETNCGFGQIALAMQYPVNDPLVQAFAEAEAMCLHAALTTLSEESVLAALDARASRQALLTPELVNYENEVEQSEGIATYIEIISAGPGSDLWNFKLAFLKKLNKDAWGADRLRYYYSGMAWSLLCDQLAPDWQEKEWRAPAAILCETLEYKPNPQSRDYPGLNFAELLRKHQLDAAKRQDVMNSTMAEVLPGTGIRVEVNTNGNPVGGGWNPNTAVTFPGIGRFHPTGLMYIFDNGTRLNVAVNCIEKTPCRLMVFERPDLTILIDGSPCTTGGHQGQLMVSGGDVEIKMAAAKVNFTGQELQIIEL